jgi:hypothetical protein
MARAQDEGASATDASEGKHPWALTAHLMSGFVAEGLSPGLGRYHDAGLAGAGLALRVRLDRHFSVQAEGNLLAGANSAGYGRLETLGLGSVLLFLNPDDRFQIYLEGTTGLDGSRVASKKEAIDGPTYTYYNAVIGGGIGAEWRAFERVSFTAHVRSLLRGRLGDTVRGDSALGDPDAREAKTAAMTLASLGATYHF